MDINVPFNFAEVSGDLSLHYSLCVSSECCAQTLLYAFLVVCVSKQTFGYFLLLHAFYCHRKGFLSVIANLPFCGSLFPHHFN